MKEPTLPPAELSSFVPIENGFNICPGTAKTSRPSLMHNLLLSKNHFFFLLQQQMYPCIIPTNNSVSHWKMPFLWSCIGGYSEITR